MRNTLKKIPVFNPTSCKNSPAKGDIAIFPIKKNVISDRTCGIDKLYAIEICFVIPMYEFASVPEKKQ